MLKRKLKSEKQAEEEAEHEEYLSGSSLSSSESEDGCELSDTEIQETNQRPLKENHKVLILASRGINARHRHLMLDLHNLLPHSKKGISGFC